MVDLASRSLPRSGVGLAALVAPCRARNHAPWVLPHLAALFVHLWQSAVLDICRQKEKRK